MDGGASQNADVGWDAGDVPVSAAFGEAFFSNIDGLGESRHVFLAGNDLPARFVPGFAIGELGFGTGLNALAAAEAWRASGTAGCLRFTSFEAHPLDPADMQRALARWPGLEAWATPLVAAWHAGAREIALPGIQLRVIEGDARATLPAWRERADAWFLDGFSPAKNPAMWEPALLAALARATVPGGTCATYSAAGSVRAGLAAAGFTIARVAGFGRKRHMTRGRLGDAIVTPGV
jgi:tRNA U34 5-methylaminomethyl-2-thiouridine-forming methyltransferase MnmC